jgi:CubicO group peptidase (beta-lactamase class C family)
MVRKTFCVLVIVAGVIGWATGWSADAGARYPDGSWLRYASPEDAGWSTAKLDSARGLWEQIDSAAFMVIHDGAVLVAWGDVTRRFMCHSVRKSFLSALYGVYVHSGEIAPEKTLAELGIDDEPPLTETEKQAKIIHLLKARSGVYHPAAYESAGMKKRRPQRGSHAAGTFWYYNNWDFNALCTIFEQETGKKIFEEFKKLIAEPVGMEDFRLIDTYYHLESFHSMHPAYPFKMSARDMARFGLLFLRNGRWGEEQIVPEQWVRDSARSYSDVPGREGTGYGYMWWVVTDPEDRKYGMYMARGVGEQTIAVLPGQDLVIVNRADTWLGHSTDRDQLTALIDLVLDARVSPPETEPALEPLKATVFSPPRAAGADLKKHKAAYQLDYEDVLVSSIPFVIGDMIGRTVRVTVSGSDLLLTDELGQRQILLPLHDGRFLLEDSRIQVRFETDGHGEPVGITIDGSPAWIVSGTRVPGQ